MKKGFFVQLCGSICFMKFRSIKSFVLAAAIAFAACQSSKKVLLTQQTSHISALRFLGEKDIPFNFQFKQTTVGGLSGIDYDARHQQYYLISDDRSAINPARFYTAAITVSPKGIDCITLTDMQYLLQPNGKTYPNSQQDQSNAPDPETIRYLATQQQLVWTSEGERIVKGKDTVLENPSILLMSKNGQFVDSFSLPNNLRMKATENGPRKNGVLEGLSFTDNYKSLFVNVEEPLYEDGPRAALVKNNAFIRLFKFDMATKINTAQYAYELDPIAQPAIPADAFKVNGVSEILSLDNDRFLLIERSYSTGATNTTIKVFEADFKAATNVSGIPLLHTAQKFVPASKKLLLNMDDLGIFIDNIEGVTFGPTLPNGHRTLLFVSDNNFSPLEKTQILLFEVME